MLEVWQPSSKTSPSYRLCVLSTFRRQEKEMFSPFINIADTQVRAVPLQASKNSLHWTCPPASWQGCSQTSNLICPLMVTITPAKHMEIRASLEIPQRVKKTAGHSYQSHGGDSSLCQAEQELPTFWLFATQRKRTIVQMATSCTENLFSELWQLTGLSCFTPPALRQGRAQKGSSSARGTPSLYSCSL